MLYLTEADVRSLLPMREAIDRVREGFEEFAAGRAQNQPRRRLILPEGSVLHSMAGSFGAYFGAKIYSTHRQHGAHFFFLLFDAPTGAPLAMMEANYLGQIRTGAASGYATDLLGAPEASTLGVIGTGFQAESQIEAVRAVRPIREVRVWGRDPARRQRFAEKVSAVATTTAEEAVRGAHVVVTATNARDPVLASEWISAGTHVNAVGSNVANRRELPADLIARAGLIAADSAGQARIEAGDLILAGDWSRVVELRDVPRGHQPDRITIFKSVGLGLEDVACGGWIYEKALQQGLGRQMAYS
jgi:alanine dehydrogenase